MLSNTSPQYMATIRNERPKDVANWRMLFPSSQGPAFFCMCFLPWAYLSKGRHYILFCIKGQLFSNIRLTRSYSHQWEHWHSFLVTNATFQSSLGVQVITLTWINLSTWPPDPIEFIECSNWMWHVAQVVLISSVTCYLFKCKSV
jgi:hypothetical protein